MNFEKNFIKKTFSKISYISIYLKIFFRLYINKKCKNFILPKSVNNHKRTMKNRIKAINVKGS